MKKDKPNTGLIIGLSVAAGVAVLLIIVIAAVVESGSAGRARQAVLARQQIAAQQAAQQHAAAQTDPQQVQREATYQSFTAREIRELGGGRRYVDSQLLLTAAPGVNRQGVEALAQLVGARIVGCLELTGDYQLAFDGEKTADELNEIAAALASTAYVDAAGLHEVYETSVEALPQWEPSRARAQLEDYAAGIDPWDNACASPDEMGWEDLFIPGYPTGNDWWTQAVNLPAAWNAAEARPLRTVKVGVIDSIFDTAHGDLHFEKTYLNPASPEQSGLSRSDTAYSHGTHVSGIIAATAMNGRDIRGASPNARLYGFAMAGEDFGGSDAKLYDSDFKVKYAIAAMLGEGVRLFNFSMGYDELTISAYYDEVVLGRNVADSKALSTLESRSKAYAMFLERCEEVYPYFLIIASAGNNSGQAVVPNSGPDGYSLRMAGDSDNPNDILHVGGSGAYGIFGRISPGSRAGRHIVIVGSADLTINVQGRLTEAGYVWTGPQNYVKSYFSNEGASIYAPGGMLTETVYGEDFSWTHTYEILSTVPTALGGTGMKMGTSMAAPMVTGIAALVWGYRPELTSEQLRLCLTSQTFAMNRLLGYTNGSLPIVDALAALRMADEIAGGADAGLSALGGMGDGALPAPTAAPTRAPTEANKAFFLGYGYTNENHSDNPEDFLVDRNATIMMFDENWVSKGVYRQDGADTWTIAAEPGNYYVRVVSEDQMKEFIGEYELKIGEPAYAAVELVNRPCALYRFGVHQTTKRGEWYESGAGTVSAQIAGLGASIDYEYDARVWDYDPEKPEELKAEGTGELSQMGMGVGYTMKYADGQSEYVFYVMGMPMDVGSVGLEPELFDFDQITEDHLTHVEEVDDYSFLVCLDSEQLATLTFTAVGALNDMTGLGMDEGAMYVEFDPDMSFREISFLVTNGIEFDLGELIDALGAPGAGLYGLTTSASAQYELMYQFSDSQINPPRTFETLSEEEMEEMLFGLMLGGMGW